VFHARREVLRVARPPQYDRRCLVLGRDVVGKLAVQTPKFSPDRRCQHAFPLGVLTLTRGEFDDHDQYCVGVGIFGYSQRELPSDPVADLWLLESTLTFSV
jgi:hypothetical protein